MSNINLNDMTLCIIVGAQKAGTSSLFSYLSHHPEICASREKETNFLLSPKEEITPDSLISLFDFDREDYRVLLEASPAYTGRDPEWRNCAQTLVDANLGPETRIIYLLREPISRIKSSIRHGLDLNWDKLHPEWMSFDPEGDDIHPRLIDATRYASHARNYIEAFGRDNVLLICFEDMIKDPAAVYDKCISFLGLAEHPFAVRKVETNTARERAVEKPQWIKRITESPINKKFTQLIPEQTKTKVREILYRKKTLRNGTPNDTQIQFIIQTLSPEVAALKNEFGFSPETWQAVWRDASEKV